MSTVTNEVEIISKAPVETVFKVLMNSHIIAPKAAPQFFKSIETIEGDGGAGTIRVFTFGDDLPFKTAKLRLDAIDASNFTYSYTFFEGDNLLGILDSINHHVKITPSADGGSVSKQTIIYKCKGEEKPSEDILAAEKAVYEQTYRAMEAYAGAHPESY